MKKPKKPTISSTTTVDDDGWTFKTVFTDEDRKAFRDSLTDEQRALIDRRPMSPGETIVRSLVAGVGLLVATDKTRPSSTRRGAAAVARAVFAPVDKRAATALQNHAVKKAAAGVDAAIGVDDDDDDDIIDAEFSEVKP